MSTRRLARGRPWQRVRRQVAARRDPCHICGDPIDYTIPYHQPDGTVHPNAFTVDHVLPLADHPHLARDLTNCKAAHATCNRKKSNNATEQLRTSQNW